MNPAKYFSLLAAVACVGLSASAADYASSSRLAAGRWVKVRVAEEGIQQISYEQLRAWGFDDPSKVQVYGYGATALALDRLAEGADDLPATPTLHTADGRVLFYGDADVRFDLRNLDGVETLSDISSTLWRHNIYDRGGYYFLSDAGEAAEPVRVAAPATVAGDVYSGHFHVDATDRDMVTPIGGGNIFCERSFTAQDPCRIELSFRDAVLSELEGGVPRRPVFAYYCCAGYGAEMATDGRAAVDVSIEGVDASLLGPQRMEIDYYSVNTYIDLHGALRFSNTVAMPDGSSTVTLSRPDVASAYNYYLDRHALIYPRLNRLPADEAQLVMHYNTTVAGSPVRIAGATAAMQLWDVSDPAAVRILELRAQGDDAYASMPESFGADKPGRMVLFDPARTQLQPEYVGEVAAQNLHALPVPDMLIITTDELEAEALRLAQAHESIDGLSVAVCRSRDIYNEYSGGAATPAAYRRLARSFYSRDPQRFRYVLLMGSSLRDQRGILSPVNREVLSIHQAVARDARLSGSTAYASDSYVGWMSEAGDCLDFYRRTMDVSVGRLPAKNPGEARAMVNHTIDYMQNPPAGKFAYRALMASGAGDKFEHYNFSMTMINVLRSRGTGIVVRNVPIIGYDSPATAAPHFYEGLREGCGLFGYFGHSAAGRDLANTQFYSDVVADRLDYNVYPLAVLATCSAFHIDSDDVSVGVSMVAKEHGGAIGVIAATRAVFSTYNRDLANAVAAAYATGRPGETTGDIFRRGHNSIMTGGSMSSAMYNTKCYNLCGDPAVRLPFAADKAVLEAWGSAEADDAIARGNGMLRLSGYIDDGAGNVDTGFDGTIAIEIFDTPMPGTVLSSDAGTKPRITLENIRLATATASVEAGRWEAEVFVPAFSRPGGKFALSLDATAEADATRTAHGYFGSLSTDTANGDGSDVDDAAPVIAEMYIDSPDFADGGETGSDIVLHARIAVPATGLNLSAAALRGSSRAELDNGSTTLNIAGYCTTATDGSGDVLLSMPFSALSAGRHTLRLGVSSGAGSYAERTLGFTVDAGGDALLAVDTEAAAVSATFSVTHTLDAEPELTLVITDSTGRNVRTLRTGASQAMWDLCDNDGQPVPDGIYRAHAMLRSGLRHAATEAVELVVLRDGDAQ